MSFGGGSSAAEMLIYVVITMKIMSRKKADLRLAQSGLHAEVTVNRKILNQPLYDPVAKPSTLPTAINSEKYAFATRVLLLSLPKMKESCNYTIIQTFNLMLVSMNNISI